MSVNILKDTDVRSFTDREIVILEKLKRFLPRRKKLSETVQGL